jgi:phosphoglycerate kinase
MRFKTIRDIDVKNKVVLLRADLNVPAKDGKVTDTTRIDRLKSTIEYLVAHGAKTLVMSHFGRPKGGPDPEFSLNFLVPVLKKQWGYDVQFADDCIGTTAVTLAGALQPGQIGLLENVRFHAGEEKNDPDFVAALADLGEIFVNDAFSSAHRAHASTEGLAHVMPTAAGFLMEAELNALNAALENPQRPLAAIVGGAKISTKLELLGNLVEKADILVLGGGMANTFLHAQGVDLKSSLCEKDMADQARAIMAKAKAKGCDILLPVDGVWSDKFAEGAEQGTCSMSTVPDGKMVLDIGPQSIAMLKQRLAFAKTIVWNGPLGAFELKPFDQGTVELAKFVVERTKVGKITSVAGGGDTVAALEQAGVADQFTYVSSAGGAFLEWMEGKTLPGVASLTAYKAAA